MNIIGSFYLLLDNCELRCKYALPAGLAGFHAVKGLSEIGGAGEAWTLIFASIGAIIVSATAWMRIASLAGPETQSGGVDSHHAGYAVREG